MRIQTWGDFKLWMDTELRSRGLSDATPINYIDIASHEKPNLAVVEHGSVDVWS